MNIKQWLADKLKTSISELYSNSELLTLSIQETNKEFEGDFTLVCFPLTKLSRKKPFETAQEIGEFISQKESHIENFNVVNGFLNISLTFDFWVNYFLTFTPHVTNTDNSKIHVMVEYSSPNTNKPLHLGHIRNNLLGAAVAKVMSAAGYHVTKVNLVNDRGIHICKSMLAWQKAGKNETPASTGIKGDHLVGNYYVAFDKLLKAEANPLVEAALIKDYSKFNADAVSKISAIVDRIELAKDDEKKEAAIGELKMLINNQTPIMIEAQEMLRKWENGDAEVVNLWKTMNAWVYAGFEETYKKMGVTFDRFYYESNTYVLGKNIVEEGLSKGVLFKKDDNSVWIDLTADGLDQKLLLRGDGTSVYMTQDIGTAVLRNEELHCSKYVYVVGNEQDYHFKVLSLILQKLGYDWAKGIYHLSYGMVDLPTGKMKSREGTVVDADDLMDLVVEEAKKKSEELGKNEDFTEAEKAELYQQVGMAALKYFILKVDPKKRMIFNPSESIDINGNTGPFIQYAHTRIKSLIKKADGKVPQTFETSTLPNETMHRSLVRLLSQNQDIIEEAAKEYSPALVANHTYELAKSFNQFYHDFPILQEEDKNLGAFRLQLIEKIGATLRYNMDLLGIELPERM
jgi:arginyl-tRNA synthetase